MLSIAYVHICCHVYHYPFLYFYVIFIANFCCEQLQASCNVFIINHNSYLIKIENSFNRFSSLQITCSNIMTNLCLKYQFVTHN